MMTFRAAGAELHALRTSAIRSSRRGWGPTAVGMVLDADVDWADVAEPLTDSYRYLAEEPGPPARRVLTPDAAIAHLISAGPSPGARGGSAGPRAE